MLSSYSNKMISVLLFCLSTFVACGDEPLAESTDVGGRADVATGMTSGTGVDTKDTNTNPNEDVSTDTNTDADLDASTDTGSDTDANEDTDGGDLGTEDEDAELSSCEELQEQYLEANIPNYRQMTVKESAEFLINNDLLGDLPSCE